MENDLRSLQNKQFFQKLFCIIGLTFISLLLFSVSVGIYHDYALSLAIFSTGVIISIASSFVGILLGFIFGFPHNENDGNHSFKEISDWLSKIIVGLGLVELKTIYHLFIENLSALVIALNAPKSTGILLGGLVLLFAIMGFVLSYFVTVTEVLKRIINNKTDIDRLKKSLDQKDINDSGIKVGMPEEKSTFDRNQFEKLLRTIEDVDPRSLDSLDLKKLAGLFFSFDQFAKSVAFYKELYAKDKSDPMPLLNAAFILSKKMGKHDDSNKLLLELVEVKPDFAAAYYNIACNYVRTGKLDDAKLYIRKAFTWDKDLLEDALADEELEPIRKDIKLIYNELSK